MQPARGRRKQTAYIEPGNPKLPTKRAKKKKKPPIYNIIILTYARNTPRSNKQQKAEYSNLIIPPQFYTV